MDLVTPAAQAKIRELTQDDPYKYLRVALSAGGCSGTYYRFELAIPEAEDVRDDALRLALTPDAATVLRGARLDYGAKLRPVRFRVLRNPNTPIKCPCGRSFGAPFPGKVTPQCQAYVQMPWDESTGCYS